MGEKGAYSTMKFIELSQEQQRIVFTQASARRVSTSTWLRKIGGYARFLLHYTNSRVLNTQVSRVAHH